MAIQPKRKRKKDNPYYIYNNERDFEIKFKSDKKNYIVKVSEEVYEVFNSFELRDISEMHEFERHIEHSELEEFTLYNRSCNKIESVEDQVEKKILFEKLNDAVESLPEIQKKRIKMYYYEGLTQKKIAEIEETSIRAVRYTLFNAINNLKKNFKN